MSINRFAVVLTWGLLGLIVALLWLLTGQPAIAQPVEWRVCPAGPPDCDFEVIQDAVDAASDDDVIKVATGVYTDVNNYGGLAQVVYVSKTLTIQGGYTTTNWLDPDPESNPSTLDAQGQGRVLYVTGSISPTIEGLRITGGDATDLGGGGSGDAGGGMHVRGATVIISNCLVYGNIASTADESFGGGLYIYRSHATLDGNSISHNIALTTSDYVGGDALGYGGGLYAYQSDVTLNGNSVSHNTANTALACSSCGVAGYGGGLFLSGDNATLDGNTIISNVACTAGYGDSGGLWIVNTDALLSNNKIYGNTASTAVGDWFGIAGGLRIADGNVTLENNIVQGNIGSTAAWGSCGGLVGEGGQITLVGNTVQKNIASTSNWDALVGGLCLGGGSTILTMNNNIVRANIASTGGAGEVGGLLLEVSNGDNFSLDSNMIISNTATLSSTAFGQAGGVGVSLEGTGILTMTNNLVADNHANTESSGLMFFGSGLARLLHTTIANNQGSGQGVYVYDGVTLAFSNTIIAGHHDVGIRVAAGSTVALEATLWHDNGADTDGVGTILTGTVNLWEDPVFVDPDAGDYHLALGSAAIDAGMNAGVTVDIDGDLRPFGAGYDVGADEFTPQESDFFVYLPLLLKNR